MTATPGLDARRPPLVLSPHLPPGTDDAIIAQAPAEVRTRIDDTDRTLLRWLDQRIEFALRARRVTSERGCVLVFCPSRPSSPRGGR